MLPEPGGGVPDGADLREVGAVAVALGIRGAALDPDDEQDDDEDRQRDEADEPEQRGQVPRRAEPGASAPPAPTTVGHRRLRLEALGLLPRRWVLLVEEVEVENVFVARTHAPGSPL